MVESVRTPYDLDNIYLEEVRMSLLPGIQSRINLSPMWYDRPDGASHPGPGC